MAERISPKDFITGAPPRLMGTEAEDIVSLPGIHISLIDNFDKRKEQIRKTEEEDRALKKILSLRNMDRANIIAFPEYRATTDKWLANGQRMYEDCGLLESCTAEQRGPKKALAGTLAGTRVLEKLADASELPVHIFRRTATVSNKGHIAKAGFHMNHITPLENAVQVDTSAALDTHSATRIYAWEGMVAPDGFTLSQKSHGFVSPWPFYRIKDDNDHGFARIEDYGGDDSSPWGTFMAMATTSVLLRVIEHPEQKDLNKRLRRLELEDAREAIQTVSADTTMREKLSFANSRREKRTAIEIQTELADIAAEFGKRFKLPEDEQYAVEQWQKVCSDLTETSKTGEIKPLATRIGWVSKKLWLERKNVGVLEARNPKAVHADMDWDSLYPRQGGRLQFPKRTGLTIVSDAEVAAFVDKPPQDTRAAIRGKLIQDTSLTIYEVHWKYARIQQKGTDAYTESFNPYQTEK